MKLEVIRGDITKINCDAIVNPANSLMIMGGGVAGAIKRRGGRIIEDEARKHAPVPIGSAISTRGGSLPATYVIHAPTMEKPAQRTDKKKVYLAIYAALREAIRLGVRCLAFPGMGTGVGGLSYDDFLIVFRDVLMKLRNELKDMQILLVAFEEELYKKAIRYLKDLIETNS